MNLMSQREEEARKVYEKYRDSYSKGNSEAFSSTLDTGYGLSITPDIVKGHGGRLDMLSEENASTTFTISLPFEN